MSDHWDLRPFESYFDTTVPGCQAEGRDAQTLRCCRGASCQKRLLSLAGGQRLCDGSARPRQRSPV